jgi:hypothetical protein
MSLGLVTLILYTFISFLAEFKSVLALKFSVPFLVWFLHRWTFVLAYVSDSWPEQWLPSLRNIELHKKNTYALELNNDEFLNYEIHHENRYYLI